jgi:uncharacterized membrane protein
VSVVPDRTPLEQAESEGAALAAERIMLFTDAVVAIAITLLALDLPVPEGDTNTQLLRSAAADRPSYLSFLISFLVIWGHWSGHRQAFRFVSRFDRLLATLNGLWLLMLVVMPFATRVLSGDGAFQARFGFYAAIQTLTNGIFVLMMWRVRQAQLYRDGAPPQRFRRETVTSGVVAGAFLVSIPVAFVTEWAYLCWAAAPLLTTLTLRVPRRTRFA